MNTLYDCYCIVKILLNKLHWKTFVIAFRVFQVNNSRLSHVLIPPYHLPAVVSIVLLPLNFTSSKLCLKEAVPDNGKVLFCSHVTLQRVTQRSGEPCWISMCWRSPSVPGSSSSRWTGGTTSTVTLLL